MFCKNLFLHVHLISVRYFFCTTQSENFCDEKVCQDLGGLQNSQPEPQSHRPANLFLAKVKILTKKILHLREETAHARSHHFSAGDLQGLHTLGRLPRNRSKLGTRTSSKLMWVRSKRRMRTKFYSWQRVGTWRKVRSILGSSPPLLDCSECNLGWILADQLFGGW